MPCRTSRSWNVSAVCCLNTELNKMVEEKQVIKPVKNKDGGVQCSAMDAEQDLKYGPGIVDKLRSRFIHLTLKESHKRRSPLRRVSSLENLVQEEPFQAIDSYKRDGAIVWGNRAKCGLSSFKKAQSMETLLMKSDDNNIGVFRTSNKLINDNVVIVEDVKIKEANCVVTEDLPKPDTVKTYKRMFEPVETKSVHRRRSPVLRASAKSSINKSLVKSSAIVDGDDFKSSAAENFRFKERRVSPPIITERLCKRKENAECDNNNISHNVTPAAQGSLVFDFRGKSTRPNVSLQPTPFGCKPVQKSVKKSYRLFDGREGLPRDIVTWDDDDDDDQLDGQSILPHPSGIVFVGENVRLGKNCLLSTRNKNLTIQFNDNATSIHEYPSERSILDNHNMANGILDETDTPVPFSGGLASYTPKGLETITPFQLGVAKPPSQVEVPEMNNTEEKETEVLKPADPDSTFSWSSSTLSSDLLF